ncbi:MAG TPA: PorV/PorQ family protein [Candidatus Eisenbacteria bacterium]|jgi:hypothetical protein
MNRKRLAWRSGAAAVLALTMAQAAPARAEEASAGTPGEWLSQYSSARTLGLGGAFVATADDPLGVLWNPAGLSAMDQNELRFETARLFEDTAINGFSFAVPGSWLPSFGVSVLSLGSSDFQKTNEMNDPLGTFHEGETAYLLTASKAFSRRWAVGTNLKLVQQTVEDFSAQGFGIDLGGWYDITPTVRVGASAMNLAGPTMKLRDVEEAYSTQLRGGFAVRVFDGRGLVAVQLDHSDGLGAQLHGGGEYWLQPGIALRLGFDDSYGTGGFTYRFAPQYQLDYGVANQTLGVTHRVGLSYRFGGFFASSRAEPAMFSPTGEKAVTKISLNARTKAEPESWSLDIHSKTDEVVRRFGGKGQPPSHIQWDGKDENGLPLPDGVYRYSLVVKDLEGRIVTGPVRMVEISTGGPQGDVPVVPVQ